MRGAIAEEGRLQDRNAIRAAVAAVEANLTDDTIDVAVAAAARDTRQLRHLADALAGEPDCLVSGGSGAPREVDRLVAALQEAGATQVRPPTCAVCRRATRPLVGRQGRRLCSRCDQAERIEKCGGCGRRQPVSARAADGTARCNRCVTADRSRWEHCSACGQLARVCRRLEGEALCQRCHKRPAAVCVGCGRLGPAYAGVRSGQPRCAACCGRRQATCSECGRIRPVATVWAAGPVCSTCYQARLAAKGTCEGCGKPRRIDPRDTSGRQLCSDCAGLPPLSVCEACRGEDRIWRNRRCFACNLADRLAVVLAGTDGTVPGGLDGLRAALAETDSPRAVLRWLARPAVAATLAGMARGDIAVTHETLDGLGEGKWVAHLRHVLVATATLPERNELIAGLEAWVAIQLNAVSNGDDRHLVDMFATWWVLRRRRARLARGSDTVDHDHTVIIWAIRLLDWLRDHDRSLAACTQADVDLWLASGPPSRRRARDFLRWARRRRLTGDVDIVRRPDAIPVASIDVAELAAMARRLLIDDTVALVDRVAGLLLLLYGQPVSRIAALTTDCIGESNETTTLRLGRSDIELPEPLSCLIRTLAATRPTRAALASKAAWLFPGGRPGQHLSHAQLTVRLNALGIRAMPARTSVLLELASQLAPAVIADMLGLDPGTAVRWVRAAAGDWNGYAARRALT